ncbi:MAG: flagellar basal body-associated FliL family protein [Hyphomicrobiaceae bacterium]|nr:flagellar basal body-associated FliL family protein [Hyphomicrobiaceae bacterium]
MAKKPAKEKEADDGAAGGEGGGGKKKLIIIGGAAVVVLALAGGAAFFFLGGKPPAGGEGGPGAAAHGDAAAPAKAESAKKASVYMDLPDMTVNLSSADQRASFLRVKITLEVADSDTVAKITPQMPKVLDAFQIYLRELRPSDLDGSAGVHRLKEELARRLNVAVYPAKVDAVLFKEILVQ